MYLRKDFLFAAVLYEMIFLLRLFVKDNYGNYSYFPSYRDNNIVVTSFRTTYKEIFSSEREATKYATYVLTIVECSIVSLQSIKTGIFLSGTALNKHRINVDPTHDVDSTLNRLTRRFMY